jgi:alkanesulfonate monooxygenase SsuD/methylene tetrahydromethanopterin reductase-like flavin-dependent oxidoreductase (luciferase family)
MCHAVEGRFLNELDVGALRAAAQEARADGVDAVFVTNGPLGDAMVLAAALGRWTTETLVGVRAGLDRHPTVLAREMTTLDLVTKGRAVLSFTGPFTDATAEAIMLCREMWQQGTAVSEGPCYPVAGAINLPLPYRDGGPPIALDLTDGAAASPALLSMVDFVLVCPSTAPPPGVEVCHIQGA